MLSQARRAQSLTIEQLSERTKIPPPVLESLERDEYHKISGPLYIKSFLRTCAVDLGVDPDQVLDLYNKFAGEAQASSPGQETVWQDEVEVSHVGLPWPRIIMVAGAAVVLLGMLLFALRGCGDAAPEMTGGSPPVMPAVEKDETEALPDTLALGWVRGADVPDGETAPEPVTPDNGVTAQEEAASPPAASPVVVPRTETVTRPVEDRRPPAEEPEPAVPEKRDRTPRPVVPGDASVVFADGRTYPVVLRLVCASPLRADIKRDGEPAFLGALWPREGEPAPPVPAAGVEQGWAYAAGGELVVFWGADDYFSLRLGRVTGVDIFVNGKRWDLSGIQAGDEFLIFPPPAGSGDGD
jgi:cytoskeletal protein RodZ